MNNQPQQNFYPPYQPPVGPGPNPYPYSPKPQRDMTQLLSKTMTVFMFVFLSLAAVSLLFGLIMSIVCAASGNLFFREIVYHKTANNANDSVAFSHFINGFAWTLGTTAKYLAYFVVTIIAKRSLKK